MRIKTITKMLSAVLSAAMLITSVPGALLAEPAEQAGAGGETREENLLKLWYDEPASQGVNIIGAGAFGTTAEDNNWQQHTLPIGNSYMGANIYGEIANEHLTFNQKTLWNGGPSEKRPNYNGGNVFTSNNKKMSDIYKEVVDAFIEGNSSAGNMCNDIVGEGESGGYGVYQSWGDIYLTYGGLTGTTETTDYERNLDLTTGVANVDFTANGTDYHREYFISHPDNVLVMKLTAKNGTMDVNVRFPVDNAENMLTRELGKDVTYTADADAGTLVTAGEMQDNQLKMNSLLKVETKDGTLSAGSNNESLDIASASEIIIYVSANTDYKNDYPVYRTGETDEQLAERVADTVGAASSKGYDKVMEDHLTDYQSFFDRLTLDLGVTPSDKTTDKLLEAYKDGSATEGEKRLLEVLLYQYGRYMTIASSREGDLPSNLQGVWQNRVGDSNRVPWGCDFHMNVNLQMNYWPTYSANLAECAIPLIDYVNSLREPGRVTAEAYFGIKSEEGEENGFSAHTQNTPFGWTCPGWAFSWGWSPAAVPWILQNCWEYYEYTGDVEYMRENLYPMMREEARLYDQILVDSGKEIVLEDGTKSTRLVSAPAYSPEHGPRTLGNAYENELIWQLYEDTIIAAETLGVDPDLVEVWKENQSRLAPVEVGDSGQIKEWYHETSFYQSESGPIEGIDRTHRHMSHLLALFPGDLISVENPEYMDAAIVSLNNRPDSSTGWGMGQRINTWARTGDGNRAHKLIKTLFNDGIYPNLWDTHTPFQIDGNFGYTSGVNEMLMQSNAGYINLLPAIPDVWTEGKIDGIVARGNFELGMGWSKGQLDYVDILSKNGNEAIVQYNNIILAEVTDEAGNLIETKKLSNNRISFATTEGESYRITGFAAKEEAPSNVRITEKATNSVTLAWDAVATEGVTYNVYRQTDGGAKTQIASGISGTTYTDEQAYNILGTLTYQVTAGSGMTESVMSESVERTEDVRLVDDRSDQITYVGGWTNYDDPAHYERTIKYLASSDGTQTASLTFTGCGIDVITTKNADRGMLEISIDGTVIGTVDTYDAGDQKRQVVFSKKDLSPGEHTIVVRATGTKNSSSSGTKIELDAFRVYAELNSPPELPSDSQYNVLLVEDGRVMAQWEEIDNADSYNIYVNGEKVSQSDKPYAWIELENGKELNIEIRAVVSGTESASGVSFNATIPKEPEAPGKVTELSAVRTGLTNASVSWKASEGAEKYLVYLGNKQAGVTADTELTLSGLDARQVYQITVYAMAGQNKLSDFAETTLEKCTLASGVSAAEKSKTLKTGETYLIKITVTPEQAENKEFTYRSSNEKAVKVDSAGKVTAIAAGEADITITNVYDSELKAVVHIKVEDKKDELPALNSLIEDANLQYKVTKSDAVNGTVIVSGVTAAGKKKGTITIPATVTKNNYTFKVTAIDKNVFKDCKKKLKSVIIGANVAEIGANSFNKCSKLKTIRFMGTTAPKKVGKNAFKGIKSNCKIFYPKSMGKSELKKLKKKMKSAGKKVSYKAKK